MGILGSLLFFEGCRRLEGLPQHRSSLHRCDVSDSDIVVGITYALRRDARATKATVDIALPTNGFGLVRSVQLRHRLQPPASLLQQKRVPAMCRNELC